MPKAQMVPCFVSGMVSLGFMEADTREIVRKAAQLISPLFPYANVSIWSSRWLRLESRRGNKKDVAAFNDRIQGATMGPLKLTPPVDERISALAERSELDSEAPAEGSQEFVATPTWMVRHSRFGRGMKDEVRGALLRRSIELGDTPSLTFDAGADPGRTWHLVVFVNNDKVLDRSIEGDPLTAGRAQERRWEPIHVDLSAYRKQRVIVRLYDLVLVPNHYVGNSYWRHIEFQ
jgi:hypothetical protein